MRPNTSRKAVTRIAVLLSLLILSLSIAAGSYAGGISIFSRGNAKGSFVYSLLKHSPISSFYSISEPIITTNKTGFLAGETLVIAGTGYQPGQPVALQITHAAGTAEAGGNHEVFTTTADEGGMFSASWPVGRDATGNSFVILVDGVRTHVINRIATIQTDKFDYAPGETAKISGFGFNPGETVTLQVVHSNGSNDGNGHLPFNATANDNGEVLTTWHVDPDDSLGSIFRLSVSGTSSGLMATTTFTDVIITVIDDDGPDDEPGQKDLNQLSFDIGPTAVAVTWNWDDTDFGNLGGNTGDACTLVDTDQDGLANFAFCVVADGNPAVQISNRLYSCSDARSDRCSNPALIPTFTSTSTASVVANSDPFRLPPFNTVHNAGNDCDNDSNCLTDDTVANVTLQLSDVGGAVAKVLNVCSYPSQEPNSDPSDCVVTPNNGFLTIRKTTQTTGTGSTAFNFSSSPAAQDDQPASSSSYSANISGSQTNFVVAQNISYAATSSLSLSEVSIPSGWTLTSASCEIQTATPTLTGTFNGTSTISGITIQSGLETICTFTDAKQATITVNKVLIPSTDPGRFNLQIDGSTAGTGADVGDGGTTGAVVVATGSRTIGESAGTGTSLSDYTVTSDCGAVDPANHTVSVSVAAGENKVCTITNTRKTGKLELKKSLVPTNDPGKFDLLIKDSLNFTVASALSVGNGGTTGAGGTTLNAGTYNLSEAASAGTNGNFYSSALACVNRGDNSSVTVTSGNVNLLASADVVCTFTNTKLNPRLDLVKTGVLDLGDNSLADPGDIVTYTFVVTNTGDVTLNNITVSDPLPGLSAITCTGQTNGSITLTPGNFITCSATYAITAADITAGKVNNVAIACDSNVQICTPPACPPDTPTCDDDDFELPIPGKLVVKKIVINDNGGTKIATDFSFVFNGGSATPFTQSGGNTLLGENIIPFPVGANQPYEVTEPAVSGYTTTYDNCTGTISNGETKTCTITNDDQAATLIVKKVVVNDNGGTKNAQDFSFQVNGGTVTPFEADGQNDLTVDAGTYSVTEPSVSGYTTTYDNCSNLNIPNGGSATCIITNDDNAPSLTLVKVVVNDNGGTATESSFTLTAAGPTGFSGAGPSVSNGASFNAGTYDLSESGPAGYTASAWVCQGGTQGDDDTITLGLGESATCTITNNDASPSLTLVKVVVNDDGGNATGSNFILTAAGPTGFSGAGPSVSNGASFDTGTYDLSESGPTGYSASAWVCVGGTQTDGDTVTVGLGESATCTITNDDVAPTLTLIKNVINDNGGNAEANDFNLSIGGNPAASGTAYPLDANTPYAINESVLSGYSFVNITGDAKCPAVLGGTVTLDEGENVTCTITNDDVAPTLTLIKTVVNDDGGNAVISDFPLFINGNPVTSGGSNSLSANTLYTATETNLSGYTPSVWGGDCAANGTITLSEGQNATCTITNDDVAPTLKLVKLVNNDNGGTKAADDWTLSAAAGTPFHGRNFNNLGGSGAFQTVFANQGYDLSESVVPGYTAQNWSCDGGTLVGSTVTLNEGQTGVTCTITNDDQAATLIIIKTVVNDNGGTAVAADFTLDSGGTNDSPDDFPGAEAPGTSVTLDSGSYNVTETGPSGYSASFSADCSGTIANGETKTCTVTNDDQAPQLVVIKHVINDNGGTAVAGDFTMEVSGNNVNPVNFPGAEAPGTNVSLDAGNYSVAETGPSGYAPSFSAGCTGSIALGETKTCTVTNNDITPTLTVNKLLVPATDTGKFNLLIDGVSYATNQGHNGTTGPVAVNAGPHTVGETAGTGTTLSDYARTISGACASDGTITLALGENRTCTITNTKLPKLIVKKIVLTPEEDVDSSDFTMHVNSSALISNPTTFAGSETGTTTVFPAAGGSYYVTETGPSGYLASFSGDCGTLGSPVTIAAGEEKTCTVTNIFKTGFVTNSSLCTFDIDPSTEDSQFRLNFTPYSSGYKLSASNPGQFFYNVLHFNGAGTEDDTVVMNIPYPFITKGATPVHVYADVDIVEREGFVCLEPGAEVRNQRDQIALTNFASQTFVGNTVQVVVTVPEGFSYVNIHLDYGLKKTWSYGRTGDDAIGLNGLPTIVDDQGYTFSNGGSQTVYSSNEFKKNPGVGGLTLTVNDEPVSASKMQLWSPKNTLLLTSYSDEDGWYMLSYKHTGREAEYSVKYYSSSGQLIDTRKVSLKANGFAEVSFP